MSGLCYVGRIVEIKPIENADRIEQAEVVCGEGGRWCGVVGKGDFKVDDHCIAYLPDAIVKPSPELAFLEKSQWRVKMQRFRGVPSECVITPMRIVKAGHRVGFDLTEELGVTKYEKALPAHMNGSPLGRFPAFIPKTDELNFQTADKLVRALLGQPWHATVKYDGSSTTAYRQGGHFGVCSRNLELQEWKDKDNAQWGIALRRGLKETLPEGIALQFEACGPGIQKNPLGLSAIDGFAFQAWCIPEGRYLNYEEFVYLCEQLNFPRCELAANGDAFDFTPEELRKLAEGTYRNGRQREGIVIRPLIEQWCHPQRLSFKVLNLLYREA